MGRTGEYLYRLKAAGRPGDGLEYTVVRSVRKTMSLQVKRDGSVVVRCPSRMADSRISSFVEEHLDWILQRVEEAREQMEDRPMFTEAEIRQYREKARKILTGKVQFWAERMGITYGRIAIRQQATRWGSCSSKGNLNFNWVLVLVPETLQDYVVVHELAHRREMNHSPRFWKIVGQYIPDYAERKRQLKEYVSLTDIQTAPEDWE